MLRCRSLGKWTQSELEARRVLLGGAAIAWPFPACAQQGDERNVALWPATTGRHFGTTVAKRDIADMAGPAAFHAARKGTARKPAMTQRGKTGGVSNFLPVIAPALGECLFILAA